jgi:hypothetical protein
MSVRVTSAECKVALFDSTTGLAFGPVFADDDEANEFLRFLEDIGERDPRVIPVGELVVLADEWRADRSA